MFAHALAPPPLPEPSQLIGRWQKPEVAAWFMFALWQKAGIIFFKY